MRFAATVLLLLAVATPAAADDWDFSAVIPWAATYAETPQQPCTVVRLGTLRGAYADDAHMTRPLGALAMTCPYLEVVHDSGAINSVSAYCTFADAAGDRFFLAFGCAGNDVIGTCEGVYDINGGTGIFAGMIGSGGVMISTTVTNPDGASSVGLVDFYGTMNIITPVP